MTNTDEFPAPNFRFFDSTDGSSGFEFSVLATPEEAWLYYEELHPFMLDRVSIDVDHVSGVRSGRAFDDFSVLVRGSDAVTLPVAEALNAVLTRINAKG